MHLHNWDAPGHYVLLSGYSDFQMSANTSSVRECVTVSMVRAVVLCTNPLGIEKLTDDLL